MDERMDGRLAERVVVGLDDPFLPLRALSSYCGLSVRTLRSLVDRDPAEALPHYRVGGKILVRKSAFDTWMEQFRSRGRPTVTRALTDLGLVGR